MKMIDRLPPLVRHILYLLIAAESAYLIETLPHDKLPLNVAGLLGVILTAVVLWVTPLTTQYGVGSTPKTSYVNIGSSSKLPNANPPTIPVG